MSPPDKKDGPPFFDEEFDWDSALAEWDKQPFSPEVAREKREREEREKKEREAKEAKAAHLYDPPRPPASTKPGIDPTKLDDLIGDEDEPSTKAGDHPKRSERPAPIAAAPPTTAPPTTKKPEPPRREPPKVPPRAAPKGPPRRGGLGHLFARRDPRDDVDVDLGDLEVNEIKHRDSEADEAVITSARTIESHAPEGLAEPLRRPSLIDLSDEVADGEMFDPFQEPRNPKQESPTVHPRGLSSPEILEVPKPAPVPAAVEKSDADDTGDYDEVGVDDLLKATSKPKLLAPEKRAFDPDAETQIGSAEELGIRQAVLDHIRAPAPKEEPQDVETEAEAEAADAEAADPEQGISAPPRAVSAAPVETWEDEKPAAAWLPDDVRASVGARSEWLEVEARAAPDRATRARGLTLASELAAVAGDAERAAALARDARELAPTSPMAQRQARAYLTKDDGPELLESLEASARTAPSADVKLHDTLLAFELLREDDEQGATKRLDAAGRIGGGDARVVTERVSRALADDQLTSPLLNVGEGPLREPLALVLKLRGANVADAPRSPNEVAARVRGALEKSDLASAARALAELKSFGELSSAVAWLGSAIAAQDSATRDLAVSWLKELAEGDDLARRTLAVRALEVGDGATVTEAIGSADTFGPEERVVLAALTGATYARFPHDLDAIESSGNVALLSAASAVLGVEERRSQDAEVRQRAVHAHATRVTGESAAAVRLGRLLAGGGASAEIASAIDAADASAPAETRALRLDLAMAEGRTAEVCVALASWSDAEAGRLERLLAAALVAERAGLPERAVSSYAEACEIDPACEAALRALTALDPTAQPAELLAACAEKLEGLRAACLLLEAHARSRDDSLLARTHAMAPTIPIASFLAERAARRAGDVEGVLKCIRERRTSENDSLELAMDSVREALLVADSDAALASERLEEAHRARPQDVALRELYERLATEPPTDRAAWRETRAAGLGDPAKAILLTEAAHEYERAGDQEGSLRTALAAVASGGGSLARAALERAEVSSGNAARLADELLSLARGTEDPRGRREAYERLADLDAIGRNDPASALLWHRSILEESPQHLPSLRHLEHTLISDRRDDELEPIAAQIAKALAGAGDPECSAHAELAVRLRLRAVGDWDGTREVTDVAANEPEPAIWALRMANAHARSRKDADAIYATTQALIARATRPAEIAALCVRAAEAALTLGKADEATALLERAASEDPGDVVTWGLLAEAHERASAAVKGAEARESLARTSMVTQRQLEAWYAASQLWEKGGDEARAVAALEAAAAIELGHADVFDRLRVLYAKLGSHAELAALLERRTALVTDPEERVSLEVERGKALGDAGDLDAARKAFEAALALRPDHVGALMASAELSGKAGDWERAEQSLVQLARLVQNPEDQKAIYTRLGEIYATHLLNLSRAELAFKEVLKRQEDDVPTIERLVELYKRQNDPARAIETQQQLIFMSAQDPPTKRKRVIELASIYETVSHDLRKAEQTLEAARREFASDVAVMRALAEFYVRHKQLPALHILLDRALADAKRAFAAGRFSPALFETVQTAFELREKKDAARVVGAALAAFTARPAQLRGAEARGCDPRLDDLIAPEALGPALRGLFAQTGQALDVAVQFDLKRANAQPLAATEPLGRMIGALGQACGVSGIQIYVAPIGRQCIPVGSNPPAIVVGDGLVSAQNDLARAFLVLRAVKMLQSRTAALARASSVEAVPLLAAYLRAFVPQWTPQGPSAAAVTEMGRRLLPGLPRQPDPSIGAMAAEAVGTVGTQLPNVAPAAIAWANRTALLAVGDPNAAFEAIAWSQGQPAAPDNAQDRAQWISRNAEVKDLVGFSVSEGYMDARARLGL